MMKLIYQQLQKRNRKKTTLEKIGLYAGGVLAGVMCWSILLSGTAFAGGLNANEEELMAIARGTFTYEGVTYRASESYINEAYYYLIRDDVDVTAEQKEAAITQVYASVKQGIDEGYLYPVSEENTTNNTSENTVEQPEQEQVEHSLPQEEVQSENTTEVEKEQAGSREDTKEVITENEETVEETTKEEIIQEETTQKETIAPEIVALEEITSQEMNSHQVIWKELEEHDMQILPDTVKRKEASMFSRIFSYGMIAEGVLLFVSILLAVKYHLFSHHRKRKKTKRGG